MRSSLLAVVLSLVACGRSDLLTASVGDAGHGTEALPSGAAWPGSGGMSGSSGAVAAGGAGDVPTPVIAEFALPTEGADPRRITSGPDGNLWFTECRPNQIGRLTPSGIITELAVAASESGRRCPYAIVPGPDGNLWFTEAAPGVISFITTAGSTTEVVSVAPSSPEAIVAVGDGTLWFTGYASHLGVITTVGAPMYRFVDEFADWQEIAVAPDGSVWATAPVDNVLGRCTLADVCRIFALPEGRYPYGITAGPDGNMWFTEAAGNRVGRITPDGEIREFLLPTRDSGPRLITAASDGALWFTEYLVNKIGRITVDGQVSEFDVPTPASYPLGITAGPDGNVWFTEEIGNKIGRIDTDSETHPRRTNRPLVAR